jgi:hypothetical protein
VTYLQSGDSDGTLRYTVTSTYRCYSGFKTKRVRSPEETLFSHFTVMSLRKIIQTSLRKKEREFKTSLSRLGSREPIKLSYKVILSNEIM